MAKKKVAAESVETPESTAPTTDATNPVAAPKKRGRGRPKGSSKKPAVKKAKGKRGRPKGSKNKTKSLIAAGKRPRGRPAGSGKKAGATPSGLRGIITQIVREEVHAALLKAFRDM